MSKLLNSSDLTKLIGEIGVRGVAARVEIHTAAIQCIGYASKHGDIMHGVRLTENVSKHSKAALVAFFERNGNFQWDKVAKTMTFRSKFTADSFDDARVEELTKGKLWDSFSRPQAVVSMYDVAVQVAKLVKSYEKAVTAGHTIKNRELFEMVREAQAAYDGEQMDKVLAA